MSQARKYKKKKLGSYPFLSVTLSISLALFVIGLFGLLLIHVNSLSILIKESVEIHVFLKKNLSQNEKTRIIRSLETQRYISRKEGRSGVEFVSKQKAAEAFISDTGEDFLEFLGDNPLRDMVVLRVGVQYQEKGSLDQIVQDLERISGVFEVIYPENLVADIDRNQTKIGLVLIGFALVLFFIVVVLINNTIKLALFSQRFLIRSMQLVGATSGFIRRPFIQRAAGYGLLAALLASAQLYGLLRFANSRIDGLEKLQDFEGLLILLGILLILGVLVGMISTRRAIKKYLKMSLDELY